MQKTIVSSGLRAVCIDLNNGQSVGGSKALSFHDLTFDGLLTLSMAGKTGINNKRVWDTSNRAINVGINNLKGIFFDDDDFEQMS